jgi:hypothetical protein
MEGTNEMLFSGAQENGETALLAHDNNLLHFTTPNLTEQPDGTNNNEPLHSNTINPLKLGEANDYATKLAQEELFTDSTLEPNVPLYSSTKQNSILDVGNDSVNNQPYTSSAPTVWTNEQLKEIFNLEPSPPNQSSNALNKVKHFFSNNFLRII